MNTIDKTSRQVQPAPLRVSRVFQAPRETVFKAWSSARSRQTMVLPERLFGSRSDGRDAGRRPVRGLHALAARAGALDQGNVHRGRGAGAPDDRPPRDRPLRRRTIVQRRHAGQVHRRRWRYADGGGADLYGRRHGAGRADAQGRARRLAPDARQARGGNRAHSGERRPVGSSRRFPRRAHL